MIFYPDKTNFGMNARLQIHLYNYWETTQFVHKGTKKIIVHDTLEQMKNMILYWKYLQKKTQLYLFIENNEHITQNWTKCKKLYSSKQQKYISFGTQFTVRNIIYSDEKSLTISLTFWYTWMLKLMKSRWTNWNHLLLKSNANK